MPTHYNPQKPVKVIPKYGLNQILFVWDATKPQYWEEVQIYRIKIDHGTMVTYQTDRTDSSGKQHWDYIEEKYLFETPKEAVGVLLQMHKEMSDSSYKNFDENYNRWLKTRNVYERMSD